MNAARAAKANRRTATPKSKDGAVETLRVLRVTRVPSVRERRSALQLLRMTIISAPDELHDQVGDLTRMYLLRLLAAWRPDVAMLCGVAPLPASSGMTLRHRRRRGGDRQANRALHLAVIGRIRLDPKTQAYAAKKTGEGHSKMEAIRCLKRYLAREIYYLLTPDSRPSLRTPDSTEKQLDSQESIRGSLETAECDDRLESAHLNLDEPIR